MTMTWVLLHEGLTADILGFLPGFLSDEDPRPAKEQIHDRYGPGGGWQPFAGLKLTKTFSALTYPGDPPMRLLAMTMLRQEIILFYESEWLAIVQPDGTYEVSRID